MPRSLAFFLAGAGLLAACRPAANDPSTKSPRAAAAGPATLAVAGPELVAPLAEIAAEFAALAQVEVRTVAVDSVDAAADVVVFPAQDFAAWAPRLDRSLLSRPAEPDLDQPQLLRERLGDWDERTVAAPLTAPVLYLAVRRDALAAAGASAPTDWRAYDRLIQHLRAAGEENSFGALEPLAPGAAVHTFLTRASAYAKHPNYFGALFAGDDLRPRLAEPPFVRALTELVAAVGEGSPSLEMSVDDVRARLYAGEAAVGLCWPQPSDATVGDQGVDFYPAPGSVEVYHPRDQRWMERHEEQSPHVPYFGAGGWLIGVAADAKNPTVALQLAQWLAKTPSRRRLAPAAVAAPVRFSDLAAPEAWTDGGSASAQSFAAASDVVLHLRDGVGPLRIPGAGRYLAALDDAVRRAVSGAAAPEQALATAAAEWEAITDELGRAEQAKLYRASVTQAAP